VEKHQSLLCLQHQMGKGRKHLDFRYIV